MSTGCTQELHKFVLSVMRGTSCRRLRSAFGVTDRDAAVGPLAARIGCTAPALHEVLAAPAPLGTKPAAQTSCIACQQAAPMRGCAAPQRQPVHRLLHPQDPGIRRSAGVRAAALSRPGRRFQGPHQRDFRGISDNYDKMSEFVGIFFCLF